MAGKDPLRILTINSGSSSLKVAVYNMASDETLELTGSIERIGLAGSLFQMKSGDGRLLVERHLDLPNHDAAFKVFFEWLEERLAGQRLAAAAHRVVHGGARHTEPQWVTPALMTTLRKLIPLAPDHLPHEISAIDAVSQNYPDLPQIACFDTSFHRHMPRLAQLYALPRHMLHEGMIRYGFHGLSYEYILAELKSELGEAAKGRVVIAHLGNGASMAAVRNGKGIDTTMGLTPTGGLVMGTRTGDLDPGVVLYLLAERGLHASTVSDVVNKASGLLGVSGITSDMKTLLDRETEEPNAAEAVNLFCYQAKKFLAAMAAALGGLDTLVFTAGIGENAPAVRWRICEGMAFMGIRLHPERNDANEAVVSADDSQVTVRVMKTNEDLMIARHATKLIREKR